MPVEGSGHVVLWNLANAHVERLNQANLLAEDDEFDGKVDAKKGFKGVCKPMSLNGAVYFTPLPPTYQEKKEEQISSSIVFPLSLFSHSQILFTVELEVS